MRDEQETVLNTAGDSFSAVGILDDSGTTTEQTAFEAELARLIVDVLQLETEAPAIAPDARLFREGLGLDSIDALELALALSRRYGVELKSDDERNAAIFRSLRSLARHIETHRSAFLPQHPGV